MSATAHPPQWPRLLAIDTSTERMALALHAPGGPWHVVTEGGAAASAGLLPRAHALLADAGLALAQLQYVAFGCGPGAFTGLRTSCAVAQGLALGIGCPVLAIDSLLIVAEDARAQAQRGAPALPTWVVEVAMDARMDEVYAARYRCDGGVWQVLRAPALYGREAFNAALAGAAVPDALAGSAWTAFGPRLDRPAAAAFWPDEADRAAALLRLALQAAARGAGVDAANALPVYLRDKVAFTTAEREARRDGAAPRAAP